MIDANLLIYSYNEPAPLHLPSKQWLGEAFSYEEEIGIPLQLVLAFVRVLTNPNFSGSRSSIQLALAAVDSWLELANVRLVTPGAEHWPIFKQLCIAADVVGDLATDAHLAAITIENDATLYSVDRDFERFPGLRWRNPLGA